ncbi:MAG: serine/threonine protein kinase [Balneolaceae bacterium]|nr:MAG: serine/threonine protein kinase [Balneolaceae bacterium]
MSNFDAKRREQLDHLFQQVLDLPKSEREQFIKKSTGHDPSLSTDLKKLLLYAEESESFLGDTVSDFLAPLMPILQGDEPVAEFTLEEGTRIGSYRIKELVGKGGMGQVYLAERDDGVFKKEVALKCIKKGMDSEEILKRFRYERQILASLQHPNIAQLIDGGLTDDGRPYLVMEYVEGVPIAEYCDQHKLTIRERLRLFLSVCDAVQYAHQKLVVHRDLKPSNILVTVKGVVKLLDFGIARLLDTENPNFTAPVTRAGFRLMTPEYAAPEQLKNEPVSTATDVYSLGVLLLELLSGPLTSGEWKNHEQASKRIIKNISAVSDSTPSIDPETIALKRSTTPAKLSRDLRGDLDTILLTALKEDPAERYNSAALLMADISNYLNELPVTARPDSARYRLRKFVSRHKAAVSTATGVVLLTLVFVATLSYQLKITSAERDRAELERDRASNLVGLYTDIFASADLSQTGGDTITVYQLLERSIGRIEQDLVNQPASQALMWEVLGDVYQNLGLYPEAEKYHQTAVDLYSNLYETPSEHIALAQIRLGRTLLRQSRYNEAVNNFESALNQFEAVFGRNDFEVSKGLNDLALAYERLGESDKAEAHFLEALEINERLLGTDDYEYITLLGNLGHHYFVRGRYDDSERLLTETVHKRRTLFPDDHIQLLREMSNLASVYTSLARYNEAELIMRDILDKRVSIYGRNHPDVARTIGNLSVILREQGRLQEAEESERETLDIRLNLLGPHHADVAASWYNLGAIIHDQERYEESEAYFRRAIEIDQKLYGELHPLVAVDMVGLANSLRDQGRVDDAYLFYKTALEIQMQNLTPEHIYTTRAMVGMGSILTLLNRAEEAEPLLRDAIEFIQKRSQEPDWTLAEAQYYLADCLVLLGNNTEAEELLTESYHLLVELMGPENLHTRKALSRLQSIQSDFN